MTAVHNDAFKGLKQMIDDLRNTPLKPVPTHRMPWFVFREAGRPPMTYLQKETK